MPRATPESRYILPAEVDESPIAIHLAATEYVGLQARPDGGGQIRARFHSDIHPASPVDGEATCAVIVFDSAAGEQQNPHLKTTMFLMNPTRNADRKTLFLNPAYMQEIVKPLRESYAGALDYETWRVIGAFHRDPYAEELRIVGVPQALVQKFFFSNEESNFGPQKHLSNNELFSKWRE